VETLDRHGNDLSEVDLQDNLYLITLDGKRALNPGADTATRVLDMGTGTGLWALEFGKYLVSSGGRN